MFFHIAVAYWLGYMASNSNHVESNLSNARKLMLGP